MRKIFILLLVLFTLFSFSSIYAGDKSYQIQLQSPSNYAFKADLVSLGGFSAQGASVESDGLMYHQFYDLGKYFGTTSYKVTLVGTEKKNQCAVLFSVDAKKRTISYQKIDGKCHGNVTFSNKKVTINVQFD